MIQIIIPTKNRAGKTITTKLLDKVDIPYHLLIEPQDIDSYKKYHQENKFIILPENDKGIVYARQFILDTARKNNWNYIWQLDDDIMYFGYILNGKTINKDANILIKATNQLLKYEASLYSLELRQHAWSSKEIIVNKNVLQCVLFNMKNCSNLNYDLNLRIREDYDLSIQSILNAKGTIKTAKYFYGCAEMKSQKGGMEFLYKQDIEKQEVIKFCNKYPEFTEPVFKRNRYDIKFKWNKFRELYASN